ncbi:MAG: PDZ domain-containing protein [Bacteroidota bacterium]
MGEIIEASGAETAGVQQGDIITAFNGQPVEGHESLVDQIRQHQVGDEVQLTMMRKGQEMTQTATLGKTHYKKDVRVWMSPHNEDMMKELEQQFESMDNNWNEEKMQELQQRLMERSERYFRYKVDADEDAEEKLRKKAFLGITGSWNNDGDQPDNGVKIGSVIPNSTASEMGLQQGDVITRINDDEIQDFESLVSTLKSMEPGQKVKLQYLRNGKKEKANGELKSRADSQAKSARMMRSWVSGGDEAREKDISIAITIEDISDEEVEEMAGKTDVALAPTTDSPGFDVEFYPNPNHGQFKLSFDVPNGGDVVIRAVDALGREVYAQTLKGFSGRYSDEIDLGSDNRGVFFLTVEHSGSRFTKKVVIE